MRETCNIQQPHKELRDSSLCQIQESTEKQYKRKDTFIPNTTGQHSYQHCHRFISLSTSISSVRRLYNQVKTRQAGHWHTIFTWHCILYQHSPSHACHTNALRANKGYRVCPPLLDPSCSCTFLLALRRGWRGGCEDQQSSWGQHGCGWHAGYMGEVGMDAEHFGLELCSLLCLFSSTICFTEQVPFQSTCCRLQ